MKRIFDIIVSMMAIIVISPILLLISFLILITSDGPIIFRQLRVGRDGLLFEIFKFRTMVHNAEKLGDKITRNNDPRITKIGSFLRQYKLDELPQFFNVLKGDMSFVGPRPEVPKYVKFYTKKQREILCVRPGITDLASIKYSDESSLISKDMDLDDFYVNHLMPKKIRLNKIYIKKSNFWYDFKIILRTLFKIAANKKK